VIFFIKEATPPISLKETIILQSFTTKIQPPPREVTDPTKCPEKLTTLDCREKKLKTTPTLG
jgi:FAD synthase